VQQELEEQLAAALKVELSRVLVVQMYAAGQFAIVDLLPGEPPSLELKARLVDLASYEGSALFQGRVLGMLDGLKELLGSEQVQVLLAATSRPNRESAKAKPNPVVSLLLPLIGVGLVSYLTCQILYGVACKGCCSAQKVVEQPNAEQPKAKSPQDGAGVRKKAARKPKRTDADDDDDDETAALNAPSHRGGPPKGLDMDV